MFDDFETEALEQTPEIKSSGGLCEPRQMLDCLGHQAVEEKLISMAESGRLPHAMIFSGIKGIGKATMAYRFIRYLMAEGESKDTDTAGLFGDELPAEKSCSLGISSEHPVYAKIAAGAHPDLYIVERPYDEKKDRKRDIIDVDTVRKVEPFMRMTASQGGWRIVLVDDADSMNRNAQNALLKILEEPPARALLILVTHRPGAIIPTIRSRCRTVQFQPLSHDDFNSVIRREHGTIGDNDLEILYQLSSASPGQALSIYEEGGLEAVDKIMLLLHSWPDWDWVQIHQFAENTAKKGQENSLQAFEDVFLWIIRALLQAKAKQESLPTLLNNEPAARMFARYSLIEWIELYGKIREHFNMVKQGNLDKRQAVLGTFTILNQA